jgi:hypothetical protein
MAKDMSQYGSQLFNMMADAHRAQYGDVRNHRDQPVAQKPHLRHMDERSVAQARMDYEVGEMEAREAEQAGNDSAYNAYEDNSTDHYDAYPEEGY